MLELAAEQRAVLSPCSWETYEHILADHADRSAPRFTYAHESLEIMSPSPEHEEINLAVLSIILAACEELDIEVRPLGSATQRRVDLQKGVEPDSSFFFGDVERDPACHAPDLVVEVEISRSALDKLAIFAQLGIPEVWRWRDGLSIFQLQGAGYVESPRSSLLPLDASGLCHQMGLRGQLKRNAWLRGVRQWIRAQTLSH